MSITERGQTKLFSHTKKVQYVPQKGFGSAYSVLRDSVYRVTTADTNPFRGTHCIKIFLRPEKISAIFFYVKGKKANVPILQRKAWILF